MKNKKLLYGGLIVGAVALAYFLNKKNKSIVNKDNLSTDSLANDFTSELINSAKNEISILESELEKKKKTAITPEMTEREKILAIAQTDYENQREKNSKISKINFLKTVIANESNILNGFKKSIPNFKSEKDAILAKNVFIKMTILDDSSKLTLEERSLLNNSENYSGYSNTMGFDMPFISQYYERQLKKPI